MTDEELRHTLASETRAEAGLTENTDQALAFESGFRFGWDYARLHEGQDWPGTIAHAWDTLRSCASEIELEAIWFLQDTLIAVIDERDQLLRQVDQLQRNEYKTHHTILSQKLELERLKQADMK